MIGSTATARAAADVLANVTRARAQLSRDSDLMICATADGRMLVWQDDRRIGLGSLKGSLDGIVCHQFEAAADEMARHWNAAGGEPVEAMNLNAALCRAWGLVRPAEPMGEARA